MVAEILGIKHLKNIYNHDWTDPRLEAGKNNSIHFSKTDLAKK